MKIDERIRVGVGREEIHMHIVRPTNGKRHPFVILSHGFSVDGTESHRLFIHLMNALEQVGCGSVTFDHRGIGYSDGEFEDLTLTKEIEDLKAVIDCLYKKPFVDKANIGVLGQSHGSLVAVLALADDLRVKAFCLWGASITPYDRYLRNLGTEILEKGKVCIPNKGFYLKRAFMDDLGRYDGLSCIERIFCPTILVHAGSDEKVPISEAKLAFERIKAPKEFVVIPGGNHSYKCQIELEKQAIEVTVGWFRKNLK